MKFEAELYQVKALTMPFGSEEDPDYVPSKVVRGWYFWNVCDFVDVPTENYAEKLEFPTQTHEVNAYSICRNTGVKISEEWLFEFDLVIFCRSCGEEEMGIVVFDDFTRGWAIQSNANYSGKIALNKASLKSIIGNVILSFADAKKFQAYSDDLDKRYGGVKVDTECRTQQRINKLQRQFLPKS